jgi:spectinomycin phosphotransferase
MRLPHPSAQLDLVVRELAAAYPGRGGDRLCFAPVGEDSWSYRWGDVWVSLRRDLQGHVPAAYRAARDLHEGGLDFVIAPLPGADGEVVRRIGEVPVVVFPWLDVAPVSAGPPLTGAERRDAEAMVRSVHAAPLPAGLPVETFTLPFATELDRALSLPARRASAAGPYGPRLHRLLTAYRRSLLVWRAEVDEVAACCCADPGPLVLTHGEPSSGNVLRSGSRLLLADWGAAALAPPERDWFHVRRTLGIDRPGPAPTRRFYELRWLLGEVAEYASVLSADHGADAETDAMWARLTRYLPEPVENT